MLLIPWAVAGAAAVAALVLWALARRARTAAADAREERDRAAEGARAALERMSGSFRSLPITALRVDGQGRLIEATRRAVERFPFLEPGMGILEAFSEHELAGRVIAALGSQREDDFEVRLFAGGRRTYRVTVEPYRFAGGPEAIVALADASEAVAYQELRSQFVANVSHELRTPLTGLRGLVEALDDPEMDQETRTRFVARATHETERLEALITDILFLSELEADQGLPSTARSDLSVVVAGTAEELAHLAGQHGVALVVDAAEGAWTPLTERMAGTVVRNLMENAVKYAGAGARAETTVRIDDDRVVLTTADDGAGIAARDLPHIFERFYRADPSRSKRLGGTGLGLSIVKHIVERYGGRATASSREGFGTTVTVELPLVAAPEAAGLPGTTAPDAPARSL